MITSIGSNETRNEEGSVTVPLIAEICLVTGSITICLIYVWVIVSVAFSHRLRSQSSYFLVSLFVQELICVLMLTVGFFLGVTRSHSKFIHLPVQCTTLVAIMGYFWSSATVAADRFFKIARPMLYMRLISNKVCAVIILVQWGLLTVPFVGHTVASLNDFDEAFISVSDIIRNHDYMTRVLILANIFSVPSFLVMTAFLIALAGIARKQQRQIEAERINIGNTDTLHNPINNKEAAPRPRRVRPAKSTWYSCVYVGTVILAWVPFLITLNITIWGDSRAPYTVINVMYTLFGVSMLQIIFGALFLIFTQSDYRQVLRDSLKTIMNKVKCMYRPTQ